MDFVERGLDAGGHAGGADDKQGVVGRPEINYVKAVGWLQLLPPSLLPPSLPRVLFFSPSWQTRPIAVVPVPKLCGTRPGSIHGGPSRRQQSFADMFSRLPTGRGLALFSLHTSVQRQPVIVFSCNT